jgi:predicted pyridoxine 5'-phosphate oxidase superfamily flavin-nucleotide-binding protein
MIMMVPGLTETLRINGDAFVTEQPELLEQLSAEGKPALLATIVRVREVYFQCGKALILDPWTVPVCDGLEDGVEKARVPPELR